MVITECYFGRDCIAFVDAYFEIMLLGIKMVKIKAIMIVIIMKKIRYRRKNKSSASLLNAGERHVRDTPIVSYRLKLVLGSLRAEIVDLAKWH